MKNTDIDNVVRKHKAILGLPQGFGKKPVAEKIKILNTKARSKNVALKGFVDDYNDLKARQGAGSKVGGKGGKGGATKTGKMVKDLKRPITEKKGMKAKPKPPAPKKETTKPKKETKPAKSAPKPEPPKKKKKKDLTYDEMFDAMVAKQQAKQPDKPLFKSGNPGFTKPEPSIDEEIKKLSQSADKEIAKKKAAKKTSTAERVKEKKKPRGPRPGKVADPSKKKVSQPTEGVAGGATPVPTIQESSEAESNVFNLDADNLISSPGYAPAEAPEPLFGGSSIFGDDFVLGETPIVGYGYSAGWSPATEPEPVISGFRPKARKATIRPKTTSGKKTTTIAGGGVGIPGEIIDDETGMTIGVVPGSKADRARRLFSFTPEPSGDPYRLY